jgi:hypothetical protein
MRASTTAAQSLVICLLDKDHLPAHPLLVGHALDEITGFFRLLPPDVQCLRGEAPEDVTQVLRMG